MPHTATELANIVELVGRLWLREISLPTLEAMSSPEFQDPFVELGGFVPNQIDNETIEELAIQYCELLVGPRGHISPVQSVWSTNQFQSESAASMNRFFDLVPGYEPESNLSDHIGVQLDFLSVLLHQTEKQANEVIALYVSQHLQWTDRFLNKVISRESSEFYQGLAIVTRQLVASFE
jgi:TorA maturation chaperone TorD